MRLFFLLMLLPFIVNAQVDSLTIGLGGGFSGKVNGFKVLPKYAYKGEGFIQMQYKETAPLKRKNRKRIFRQAQQLWEQNAQFEHTYNMYKFIVLYSKGKTVNIIWGDPAYPVPDEIRKCYENILAVLGTLKFNFK